jgi:hypothetical protein
VTQRGPKQGSQISRCVQQHTGTHRGGGGGQQTGGGGRGQQGLKF